jgi:hypothetical protein
MCMLTFGGCLYKDMWLLFACVFHYPHPCDPDPSFFPAPVEPPSFSSFPPFAMDLQCTNLCQEMRSRSCACCKHEKEHFRIPRLLQAQQGSRGSLKRFRLTQQSRNSGFDCENSSVMSAGTGCTRVRYRWRYLCKKSRAFPCAEMKGARIV